MGLTAWTTTSVFAAHSSLATKSLTASGVHVDVRASHGEKSESHTVESESHTVRHR